MDDTRSGSGVEDESPPEVDAVAALEGMDPAQAVAAAERHARDLVDRLEGVVGRPGGPGLDEAGSDEAGSGEAGEEPGR